MARNHYIPKLLLRQFADGERINLFDVRTQHFRREKLKNVFYEENLYPDELEEKFARELEGPFGDLLNHRLLPESEYIKINRRENFLIRKFEFISRLRAYYNEMNQKDLEIVMKYNSFEDLVTNHRDELSKPLLYLADSAFSSYYAIWDSSDSGQEFILPKMLMASYMDLGGPLHKLKVLQDIIKNKAGYMTENQKMRISSIYYNSITNVENYSVFPISKTRLLVSISHFFKGYFPQKECIGMPYIPEVIEKSRFQSHFYKGFRMELMEPCHNIDNLNYAFTVRQLTSDEVMLQNALMLNEECEKFAFHDYNRVRDSIWAYENVIRMEQKKHSYNIWN